MTYTWRRLTVIDNAILALLVLNLVIATLLVSGPQPSKWSAASDGGNSNDQIEIRTMVNQLKTFPLNQAQKLIGSVKQRLEQPPAFPFQPTWSNETFDPDRETNANMLDRLKTHVRLRNFYSSNARLTPEFKQLYDLLSEWKLSIEVDQMQDLYMCLEGIQSSMVPLEENVELVDPRIRKELEEIYERRKQSMSQVAKSRIQIKDNAFWDEFFKIRPKIGFGVSDTRVEPGEALLIP